MPEHHPNRQGYVPGRPAYPDQVAGKRRRRSGRPGPAGGQRPQLYRGLALLVMLALLLGLGFAWQGYNQTAQQLSELRLEREAIQAKHQQNLQYYAGMRRRSGYQEYIQAYAAEFQVEPAFISAVIARESSYQKDAMAPSTGALGLMQIMKDTGEWVAMRLGVRDYSYDRLREPELNIRFGSWYINYLSAQFGGDPVMVAAAYHAGANNVKHWAMNYGADQKRISIDQIPKDNTRDYVKKVMDAYALYYEYDAGQ